MPLLLLLLPPPPLLLRASWWPARRPGAQTWPRSRRSSRAWRRARGDGDDPLVVGGRGGATGLGHDGARLRALADVDRRGAGDALEGVERRKLRVDAAAAAAAAAARSCAAAFAAAFAAPRTARASASRRALLRRRVRGGLRRPAHRARLGLAPSTRGAVAGCHLLAVTTSKGSRTFFFYTNII